MRRIYLLAALLPLYLTACRDTSGPTGNGPVHLRIQTGDGQTGTAGRELAHPLTVFVFDRDSVPRAGVPVEFRIIAGNGSVSRERVLTHHGGFASVWWTVGTRVAEAQWVEARTLDPSGKVAEADTFHASVTADSATMLLPVDVDSFRIVEPGVALRDSLRVRAFDRYFNQAPGVEIRWEGPGTLTPAVTRTGADGTAGALWSLASWSGMVTASASLASRGTVRVRFARSVRGGSPRLTVTTPTAFELLRTEEVHVRAQCREGTPPCVIRATMGERLLVTATDQIDSVLPLPGTDGHPLKLVVHARDAVGYTASAERILEVDRSPRWRREVTAGERLWDMDSRGLLFSDSAGQVLKLRAPGGAETVLARRTPQSPIAWARLAPRGVVFAVVWGTTGHRLLEIRDGAERRVADSSEPHRYRSAGRWLYTSGCAHDLELGVFYCLNSTSCPAATYAGTDDGSLFCAEPSGLYQIVAGKRHLRAAGQFAAPFETDGQQFVVVEILPGLRNRTIRLTLQGQVEELSTEASFRANNGWIAFVRRDADEIVQLWTRSPSGVVRKHTAGRAPPVIEALGPGGEVVFTAGGRRYLVTAAASGEPVDIGADWGRWWDIAPHQHVAFIAGKPYLFFGPSAYQIVP